MSGTAGGQNERKKGEKEEDKNNMMRTDNEQKGNITKIAIRKDGVGGGTLDKALKMTNHNTSSGHKITRTNQFATSLLF